MEAKPLASEAGKTAQLVNQFIARARPILADSHPANMFLLRGFSQLPSLMSFNELYKLNPAAIATYPMYRGLAKLAGMKVLKTGSTISDEINTLAHHWQDHDFFFVHIKPTDSAGEDGDFARKVNMIEEADSILPRLTGLGPDVIIVTGDHSTPALLAAHSWHPIPVLLNSKWCRTDEVMEFSEKDCVRGGLGRIMSMDIMLLAMANALKLNKFGA
jgi:2,3-bisphosphoglycerate-independent phosphoglycerate mutase